MKYVHTNLKFLQKLLELNWCLIYFFLKRNNWKINSNTKLPYFFNEKFSQKMTFFDEVFNYMQMLHYVLQKKNKLIK